MTVSMCCVNFRKLAVFDTWSRLVVHVAMDNTVVIEEISECCCVATLFSQPTLLIKHDLCNIIQLLFYTIWIIYFIFTVLS